MTAPSPLHSLGKGLQLVAPLRLMETVKCVVAVVVVVVVVVGSLAGSSTAGLWSLVGMVGNARQT